MHSDLLLLRREEQTETRGETGRGKRRNYFTTPYRYIVHATQMSVMMRTTRRALTSRYSTLATFRFCRCFVEGHSISSQDTGVMASPVKGDLALTTPRGFSAVVR